MPYALVGAMFSNFRVLIRGDIHDKPPSLFLCKRKRRNNPIGVVGSAISSMYSEDLSWKCALSRSTPVMRCYPRLNRRAIALVAYNICTEPVLVYPRAFDAAWISSPDVFFSSYHLKSPFCRGVALYV